MPTLVAAFRNILGRKSEKDKRKAKESEDPPLLINGREPLLRRLPASRPRRLTDTATAHPQLQSQLIARIPVELRLIIWEYALGPENDTDVLHLDLADGKLKYVRCFEDKLCDRLGFRHKCWGQGAVWSRRDRDAGLWIQGQPCENLRKIRSLAITCKLLYIESIKILYQSNIFDFRRSEAVSRLPSIMLPHRFQQIRRLHFSTMIAAPITNFEKENTQSNFWYKPPETAWWWFEACKCLAMLERLDDLQITLAFAWVCMTILDGPNYKTDTKVAILEPLRSIRAKHFVVLLTEPVTREVRNRLRDMPFQTFERAKPDEVPPTEVQEWEEHDPVQVGLDT